MVDRFLSRAYRATKPWQAGKGTVSKTFSMIQPPGRQSVKILTAKQTHHAQGVGFGLRPNGLAEVVSALGADFEPSAFAARRRQARRCNGRHHTPHSTRKVIRRFHRFTLIRSFPRRFIEIRCGFSGFPVYVGGMKEEVPQAKPVYRPLPVSRLPVQVQCDGFKCMAYRDPEGRWVDLFSHEILPRVLGVVPA